MELLKDEDSAINLALFKRFYFCHLFDPNIKKIFNYNVYRYVVTVFFVLSSCIFVFSAIGFYEEVKIKLNIVDIHILQSLVAKSVFVLVSVKVTVFFINADKIWNLFCHTRMNVLKSALCQKNVKILFEKRKKLILLTNTYSVLTTMTVISWLTFPLVFSKFITTDIGNGRYLAPMDFVYPVSNSIYNRYYWVVYVGECCMLMFMLYFTTLVDIFILSICWTLSSQYEVITLAFADVGHETATEDKNNSAS